MNVSPNTEPILPRLEFARDVRAYVLDYIKVCDAKAAAVSTGIALVGTVAGAVAEKTLKSVSDHRVAEIAALVVLAVVVGSIILAVCFTISTLLPRTATADGSLASFPDIVKQRQAQYVDHVCGLNEAAITAEYALHTWKLSHIALAKFGSLEKALKALTVAALATVVFVAVYVWSEAGQHEQETKSVRILSPLR